MRRQPQPKAKASRGTAYLVTHSVVPSRSAMLRTPEESRDRRWAESPYTRRRVQAHQPKMCGWPRWSGLGSSCFSAWDLQCPWSIPPLFATRASWRELGCKWLGTRWWAQAGGKTGGRRPAPVRRAHRGTETTVSRRFASPGSHALGRESFAHANADLYWKLGWLAHSMAVQTSFRLPVDRSPSCPAEESKNGNQAHLLANKMNPASW